MRHQDRRRHGTDYAASDAAEYKFAQTRTAIGAGQSGVFPQCAPGGFRIGFLPGAVGLDDPLTDVVRDRADRWLLRECDRGGWASKSLAADTAKEPAMSRGLPTERLTTMSLIMADTSPWPPDGSDSGTMTVFLGPGFEVAQLFRRPCFRLRGLSAGPGRAHPPSAPYGQAPRGSTLPSWS